MGSIGWNQDGTWNPGSSVHGTIGFISTMYIFTSEAVARVINYLAFREKLYVRFYVCWNFCIV